MADDVSMTLLRFLMLADTNQQEEIEDVLPTVLPLVICGVCMELLTEPRTLSCGHTFCTMCLGSCKVKNVVNCRLCGHNETLELGKGIFGLPLATTTSSVADKIRKDPKLSQYLQEAREQQLSSYNNQNSAPAYDEDQYDDEEELPNQNSFDNNTTNNSYSNFQPQTNNSSYLQNQNENFNAINQQQFQPPNYNNEHNNNSNPQMYPGYPSLNSSSGNNNNFNNNNTTNSNGTEEEAFKQFLLMEKTSLPNHQVASPVLNNNNNDSGYYSPSQSPPPPPRGSDYARQHSQLQQQQQQQQQPHPVEYQKPLPPPDTKSAIPAQYTAYHQNALQQQQQQQQGQVSGDNSNNTVKQKYRHEGPINFAEFEFKPAQGEEMVKKWTRSLWFTPSGFRERVVYSPIEPVYIPYYFFNAVLNESYSGEVCHISTDTRGRKTENWNVATGSRTQEYKDNLKIALRLDTLAINGSLLDPDYVSLLQELKNEPWKVGKIVYDAGQDPTQDNSTGGSSGGGWGSYLLNTIVSAVSAAKPEPPNRDLMEEAKSWQQVWEEYKGRMLEREKRQCESKLLREQKGVKVRNVMMNMKEQTNERLVYLPFGVTSYIFDGVLYRVLIHGFSGKIAAQRPPIINLGNVIKF